MQRHAVLASLTIHAGPRDGAKNPALIRSGLCGPLDPQKLNRVLDGGQHMQLTAHLSVHMTPHGGTAGIKVPFHCLGASITLSAAQDATSGSDWLVL